jgi:hypothetical protein
MEPENVVPESTPETVVTPQEESTPTPVVEKTVPYDRFKEVLEENKKLKSQPAPQASTQLDVNEIIAINASLEGLSPREKEKLAELHKLTRTPLNELRNSEDFLYWQQGYQSSVEKERALKPSSSQPETERARKLSEVILDPKTSPEEREKLLRDHGLYKDPGSKPPMTRRTLMP